MTANVLASQRLMTTVFENGIVFGAFTPSVLRGPESRICGSRRYIKPCPHNYNHKSMPLILDAGVLSY